MIEVTILIPVRSNAGDTFDAGQHAAFEEFLAGLCGGFTLLPDHSTGGWQFEGRLVRDKMLIYVVALTSITDAFVLSTIATRAKAHYAQDAIYVRYLGLSEIL